MPDRSMQLAILTGVLPVNRAAKSVEQRTAAAAPSEIDEHISNVSGSAMTRDCTISSIVRRR